MEPEGILKDWTRNWITRSAMTSGMVTSRFRVFQRDRLGFLSLPSLIDWAS